MSSAQTFPRDPNLLRTIYRAAGWARVQAVVETHGGVEYAYERARIFGDEAKKALADLPASPRRELLTTAVEYVINRLN